MSVSSFTILILLPLVFTSWVIIARIYLIIARPLGLTVGLIITFEFYCYVELFVPQILMVLMALMLLRRDILLRLRLLLHGLNLIYLHDDFDIVDKVLRSEILIYFALNKSLNLWKWNKVLREFLHLKLWRLFEAAYFIHDHIFLGLNVHVWVVFFNKYLTFLNLVIDFHFLLLFSSLFLFQFTLLFCPKLVKIQLHFSQIHHVLQLLEQALIGLLLYWGHRQQLIHRFGAPSMIKDLLQTISLRIGFR